MIVAQSSVCTEHYALCRGIGLESSLLFAQEGADVLLVDINLAAAEKAVALVQQRFPNVKAAAIKADVGKEADVKAAVDKAVELFGRLDIMVRVPLSSLLANSCMHCPVWRMLDDLD